MSKKYSRENDPKAKPVLDPVSAEQLRAWARFLIALKHASQSAEAFLDAIDGDRKDPAPVRPSKDVVSEAIREDLCHAQWQLDNLHTHFASDAPMIVSALTGGFSDYDKDPEMGRYVLEMNLAELGATAEDREEFGLPEA